MATLEDWNRLAPRPPRPRKAGYDWDVFLSYRSLNRRWVIQLYDALNLSGFDVFLDQYVLTPSQILVGGLQEGLSRSAAGVMVWSSATADSKWCEREYLSMESRRTNNPEDFHYYPGEEDPRTGGYQPDAPARVGRLFPRWRVGLVFVTFFHAGVIRRRETRQHSVASLGRRAYLRRLSKLPRRAAWD